MILTNSLNNATNGSLETSTTDWKKKDIIIKEICHQRDDHIQHMNIDLGVFVTKHDSQSINLL